MNIESMVRDTLHSHADGAPPNAGLVAGARARAGRRRARRALVGSAAGAAVGLLALAIPYGVPTLGSDVAGSGPPSVELVEASFDLPSFPFSPGWLPDGVKQPYVLFENYDTELGLPPSPSPEGSSGTLIHPPGPDGIYPPIRVQVGYAFNSIADNLDAYEEMGFDVREMTVHGRPAMRATNSTATVIIWEYAQGEQLQINADPSVAVADVERYAEELQETRFPGEASFSFDLLPEGVELTILDQDRMSFLTADGTRFGVLLEWDEELVGPLYVSPLPGSDTGVSSSEASMDPELEEALRERIEQLGGLPSEDPGPTYPGPGTTPNPEAPTRIEVGGRPADLYERPDGTDLAIHLEQQWVLWVVGTVNADDLVAIAEGIQLEPWARPLGQPAQPR